MNRSLAKLLFFVILILGMIVVGIFSALRMQAGAVITTIVLLIGLYICQYFLRCPHCGKWPDRGFLFDQYCSRCGEPLE